MSSSRFWTTQKRMNCCVDGAAVEENPRPHVLPSDQKYQPGLYTVRVSRRSLPRTLDLGRALKIKRVCSHYINEKQNDSVRKFPLWARKLTRWLPKHLGGSQHRFRGGTLRRIPD